LMLLSIAAPVRGRRTGASSNVASLMSGELQTTYVCVVVAATVIAR